MKFKLQSLPTLLDLATLDNLLGSFPKNATIQRTEWSVLVYAPNGERVLSAALSDDEQGLWHVMAVPGLVSTVVREKAPLGEFTVFCRQSNNSGTTWIKTVSAATLEEAKHVGRIHCAEDWGYDGHQLDQITVIGVIRGSAEILMWDDIEG